MKAALTASAGYDISRGLDELADLFTEGLKAVPDGGRRVIAVSRYGPKVSVRTESDPEFVTEALVAAGKAALTASGGICTPVTVDYSVPTWANVERPVKAALPHLPAPRGGLTYTTPPVFSQAVYGAGVGIWTELNDVNPGGPGTGPGGVGTGPLVKPTLVINCAGTTTTLLEAITQNAQISNFRGRFSPEQTQAALQYLEQAWASVAEIELLRQMRAFAKHISYTPQYGIARDSLVAVGQSCASFRDRYRLSASVPLRVVLKAWVKDAIRADLAKAAFPGLGDQASLAVSDAQIESWFALRNVSPIWALDDDTGDQSFAAQAAGTSGSPAAMVGYPAVTRMLIYPEGTYTFLDGGELNLGVVRDSELNAVNQYQVFSESFEAVACRGFEAWDVKAAFVVNGASAGTITPA